LVHKLGASVHAKTQVARQVQQEEQGEIFGAYGLLIKG
jgi:hypothetical protein